jgi:hypothetical protein
VTTGTGCVLVDPVPVQSSDFGNGAGERTGTGPRRDLEIGSDDRVDLAHGQQSIRWPALARARPEVVATGNSKKRLDMKLRSRHQLTASRCT